MILSVLVHLISLCAAVVVVAVAVAVVRFVSQQRALVQEDARLGREDLSCNSYECGRSSHTRNKDVPAYCGEAVGIVAQGGPDYHNLHKQGLQSFSAA